MVAMGKRLSIFTAVLLIALGVAQAAFAYTHSGPFYDSAYDPNVWNYGIGVGAVSGTTAADGLNIPSALYPGFEEAALRDMGTGLEDNIWTAAPAALAWIGTNSYGSLKVQAGVSNRFFTISGNLGNPVSNTQLLGEGLCPAVVEWVSTQPACMGTTGGYNSGAPGSIGLPAATTVVNYATLAFQFAAGCSTTLTGNATPFSTDVVINVSLDDPTNLGNAAKETCTNASWNAYLGFGGTVSANFSYGSLTYHVFHEVTADCKAQEFYLLGGSIGAMQGTHCYTAYAVHNDLQSSLEHTLAVPFASQTALNTKTLSPALTTSPNATFLGRVRTYVDGQDSSYTDEWNCLLKPGSSYSCPTGLGGGTFDCVDLPKPGLAEDYNTYLGRIREDGYKNSVVRVDDPFWSGYPVGSPASTVAPNGVMGVTPLGATPAYLYDHTTGQIQAWHTVFWCPDTVEIDVYTAPSSSTGTGPGSSTGSIDFSPITSVSYGTHFPFGIFTWLHTTLYGDTCDSTISCNVAPNFTITKPDGTPVHVFLSSPVWDSTYRAPVFDVIKFFILVGAVWFVAWRILGIGSSDGGEDDGDD